MKVPVLQRAHKHTLGTEFFGVHINTSQVTGGGEGGTDSRKPGAAAASTHLLGFSATGNRPSRCVRIGVHPHSAFTPLPRPLSAPLTLWSHSPHGVLPLPSSEASPTANVPLKPPQRSRAPSVSTDLEPRRAPPGPPGRHRTAAPRGGGSGAAGGGGRAAGSAGRQRCARAGPRGGRAREGTEGSGRAEPRGGSGAGGREEPEARVWGPRCQWRGRRRLAASRSGRPARPGPASRASGVCPADGGQCGAPLSSPHLLAPRPRPPPS